MGKRKKGSSTAESSGSVLSKPQARVANVLAEGVINGASGFKEPVRSLLIRSVASRLKAVCPTTRAPDVEDPQEPAG